MKLSGYTYIHIYIYIYIHIYVYIYIYICISLDTFRIQMSIFSFRRYRSGRFVFNVAFQDGDVLFVFMLIVGFEMNMVLC